MSLPPSESPSSSHQNTHRRHPSALDLSAAGGGAVGPRGFGDGSLAAAPADTAPEAVPCRASRLRRSLRAATTEGLLAEVINACAGGAAITGWALHFEASPLLAGLLVALPQMAQLFQIPAAWTTALLGHRRACLWLVGVSRQVTLPLALLPFLSLSTGLCQALLVAAAGLSAILGVLGNNAWVAWMGELVPRRVRGRYFGRRSALCMLGSALASAGAGALLDAATAQGAGAAALAGLQIFACAAGVGTTVLLRRQHDPDPTATHGVKVTWARALAPFADPAARGFLRYQLAWHFAVGLSGSFFALHMLRNLQMGFRMVALHGTAFAAARMLTAPLWGRLLDRVGARPVLLTCSFGLSVVPFVWLVPTPDRLWPLAVDAFFAGVLWCGHALAAFNLPLATAPRQGRPFYLAAFASVGGLAFTLGTASGGALAQVLPSTFSIGGCAFYDLQVLFVVSGVLRVAAAGCALRIHEPQARAVRVLWTRLMRAARSAVVAPFQTTPR